MNPEVIRAITPVVFALCGTTIAVTAMGMTLFSKVSGESFLSAMGTASGFAGAAAGMAAPANGRKGRESDDSSES